VGEPQRTLVSDDGSNNADAGFDTPNVAHGVSRKRKLEDILEVVKGECKLRSGLDYPEINWLDNFDLDFEVFKGQKALEENMPQAKRLELSTAAEDFKILQDFINRVVTFEEDINEVKSKLSSLKDQLCQDHLYLNEDLDNQIEFYNDSYKRLLSCLERLEEDEAALKAFDDYKTALMRVNETIWRRNISVASHNLIQRALDVIQRDHTKFSRNIKPETLELAGSAHQKLISIRNDLAQIESTRVKLRNSLTTKYAKQWLQRVYQSHKSELSVQSINEYINQLDLFIHLQSNKQSQQQSKQHQHTNTRSLPSPLISPAPLTPQSPSCILL